jgi:hypothetical protein
VTGFRDADDGRPDARPAEQPGQRGLRRRHGPIGRDVTVPWAAPVTGAVNALGEPTPVAVRSGAVHLSLSADPIFVQ